MDMFAFPTDSVICDRAGFYSRTPLIMHFGGAWNTNFYVCSQDSLFFRLLLVPFQAIPVHDPPFIMPLMRAF